MRDVRARCDEAPQVIMRSFVARESTAATLRAYWESWSKRVAPEQAGAMSRFIFPEWTETLKKWVSLLVLGAPFYLIALIAYAVTPEANREGYQPEQPVPYSHALHAGELGIDCRYCHTTVERAAKAAILPVRWVRVHDLPDYGYFNHMAHVNAAIGCEECHGRIDQEVRVFQSKPLTLGWCIDCHKNPTPYLRKPENVTKMGYDDPASPPHRGPNEGAEVQKQTDVPLPTNCSTCHRCG